ncbi:MAG: hypothetical protein GX434_00365 [Peptococcaceae bacterium]|nr:hypothetical protein [Peptococcaceae bacterium]
MKKNFYLILLLLVLSLVGCQKNDPYALTPLGLKISVNYSPQKDIADLTVGFQQDGVHFQKFLQVAQIFDDNEQGEFLGLFYDNSVTERSTYQFKTYPALYMMRQDQGSENLSMMSINGSKIVEPEPGYQVIDAAFNESWIVWIETNKTSWKIYSLNLSKRMD